MLFIGHGVTLSEAGKELTEFAHKLRIPVISSPNGMGCLDMTDPLSLGFIGRNGAYPANEAGRHADVVIAIGARFDDRSASSWLPGYSWNFPHSQADPRRRRSPTSSAATIRPTSPSWPTRAPSCASCWPSWSAARPSAASARRPGTPTSRQWSAAWEKFTRPNFDIHATPIRPERVVADCQAVLPDDAILACDVGVNHNWYMQFWKARRPQTMLNSWGFSGMGFGAAGVLGAKLAAPDRPCVAIAGDGCFSMVPHVLCTAVEYDIPVVWVIWNNFGWVSIRDIQLGMFGGRELGTMFHAGRQQDALQSRLRRLGQGQRRRCADGDQVAGLQGRARARGQGQQAVPARRARRRRGAPARDRHLAAAADALQGARVRQALGAGRAGAGEVGGMSACLASPLPPARLAWPIKVSTHPRRRCMLLVTSAADAMQRSRQVHVNGRDYTLAEYVGAAPKHGIYVHGNEVNDNGLPQGFLVIQPPGAVTPAHFHDHNQFQVFVEGNGRIGAHPASPLTVQYANGHTPYGPIVASDSGVKYFTLRQRWDAGAKYLPASRDKLVKGNQRARVKGGLGVASDEDRAARREPLVETVFPRKPMDLPAGSIVWAPAMRALCRSRPSGGGQYLLVTGGAMVADGAELPRHSVAFVSPDEGAYRGRREPSRTRSARPAIPKASRQSKRTR